jgi:hypothetical protein
MSVADWFGITAPLSKYYVRKTTTLPGPETNLGPILPIALGRIENDAQDNVGGVTGYYTWYRLSHFEGNPNTQGKELREYLLVCRNVSATQNNCSFSLRIPDGGFNHNYLAHKLLLDSMTVRHPVSSSPNTWNFNITGNSDLVQMSTAATFNPNGESFFLYVMGI